MPEDSDEYASLLSNKDLLKGGPEYAALGLQPSMSGTVIDKIGGERAEALIQSLQSSKSMHLQGGANRWMGLAQPVGGTQAGKTRPVNALTLSAARITETSEPIVEGPHDFADSPQVVYQDPAGRANQADGAVSQQKAALVAGLRALSTSQLAKSGAAHAGKKTQVAKPGAAGWAAGPRASANQSDAPTLGKNASESYCDLQAVHAEIRIDVSPGPLPKKLSAGDGGTSLGRESLLVPQGAFAELPAGLGGGADGLGEQHSYEETESQRESDFMIKERSMLFADQGSTLDKGGAIKVHEEETQIECTTPVKEDSLREIVASEDEEKKATPEKNQRVNLKMLNFQLQISSAPVQTKSLFHRGTQRASVPAKNPASSGSSLA